MVIRLPKKPNPFALQQAAIALMYDTQARSNEPKPSAFAERLGIVISDLRFLGNALIAGDRTDEIRGELNIYDTVYNDKFLAGIKNVLAAAHMPEESYSKILGVIPLSHDDPNIIAVLSTLRKFGDREYVWHGSERIFHYPAGAASDHFRDDAFDRLTKALEGNEIALHALKHLIIVSDELEYMHLAAHHMERVAGKLEQWQKAASALAASNPLTITISDEQRRLLQDNGKIFRDAFKSLDEIDPSAIPDELSGGKKRFESARSALDGSLPDSLPAQVSASDLQRAVQSFVSLTVRAPERR